MRPASAAVLLSLAGASAASAGDAQDHLELVLKPAYRAFELGEAVYVRCWIRNPHMLRVAVESRHASVSKPDWKAAKTLRLYSQSHVAGKRERDWCEHRTVPVGTLDLGWSLGRRRGLDEVTFRSAGEAACTITVRVIVERKEKTVTSLAATCVVFLAERISEYDPPLTAEQRRSPWLYRLQTAESVYPSKPEFDAIMEFALANSATPIGRNLLFRLAKASSRAVPLYGVPETQADRALSFAEVVMMPRRQRKVLRLGGSFGPEGPRPDIVVKLLEKLLENDSGHFFAYDEAALTLAEHLMRLGRQPDAQRWCRRIIARGSEHSEPAHAAKRLLAKIERGRWEPGVSGHAERPKMTDQELQDALGRRLQFSSLGGELPLSELIYFLGVKIGTRLPVSYEPAELAKTVVAGVQAGSEPTETVRSYLSRLLQAYGLSYRVSGGYIVIVRSDRHSGPKNPDGL